MNDQSTVRLVIGVLGLLALSTVIGGIYLTATGHELPGELIAIGSAAAGAIGGILSRTGSETQQVTGPGGGPVPVTDESGVSDAITLLVVVILVVVLLRVLHLI